MSLGGPAAPDDAGEQVALEFQVIDQPTQRGDPGRVRGAQLEPVQQLEAGDPEQVGQRSS
jgi:hypothetical protein